MLYPRYQVWRKEGVQDMDGILVATDITQEWMLSWWWGHYSKHNRHPVAFVDFGMSEEARDWCRERGQFIPLRVADLFVAEKEEVKESLVQRWEGRWGEIWTSRRAWFKKPLACLQSPFRRTVWLDLDCEVRGSIEPLFAFSEHPSGIALNQEPMDPNVYNSGVIPFRHGISLIETWAKECIINNHLFAGDQNVLSHILVEQNLAVGQLPDLMNWRCCFGMNPDALIYHWCGSGHQIIRNQIQLAMTPGFMHRSLSE